MQQLFSIHNLYPALTNTYKDNPLNLFDPTFNINLQITDLPTGQLAEAQITSFDSFGRPNSGTLLIDDDANGIGWFIDPTPWENSEFTTSLTDTAFRATTGEAFGKYDLLTTILHEMGHLAGIIAGNPGFDRHIQTINSTKTFIGNNFTATLTPDGSHLDSQVHPYDLMNNTLAPGVRKLPSWLNLQMLTAIRNTTVAPSSTTQLTAPLTAILLADITNGNFTETDTTKPEYAWTTRGAATILNQEAILTEDSPLLSNFTQTFIIPEQAKYLQFTLNSTILGTNTPTAPGDAFEVALLNPNTKQSLINTSQGLSQTDSLLNIQNNGTYYTSNKVTLVNTTPNSTLTLNQPLTFKVDLTGIQPGTAATLYFDLLGFGARDAKVILDNVMLLGYDFVAPVANNDTATTNQTQPVTINLLANDTDADSSINPSTLIIQTNPSNGTIQLNPDSTVTYTPNPTFVGTDTFTYTITDTEGLTSNTATVNITVNNIAPVITVITGDTTTTEGTTANFSATAVDPGDELTYLWNFGDGSQLVEGENVTHTYTDNGTYIATLTVIDSLGVNSFQTLEITVNNAAPIVEAGADQTINEGQTVTFNGNFTDPGILDTHTIEWDFGDGTTVTGILNPNHIYKLDGTYTAKLTVTDNDGAVTTDTLQVQVNHVAPREITKLKFEQKLLNLKVYENSQLVEHVKGRQNQPISPLAFERIQILALNSNDQSQIFDDITFHDSGEGIGITDGEDGNTARKKRIDGDEILQIKIQPTDKYNSAKTAFVTVDKVQSTTNKTIGGQVKIVALRGATIVGEQTYTLTDKNQTLTFTNTTAFDRLHLMAGDADTEFTLRVAEFEAIKTNSHLPTYLEFSQELMTLKVRENGSVVEQIRGSQNQPVVDAFARIKVTAIDSQDIGHPLTDRTFHDNGEGIGIVDGEDGNTASKKRIDGDEILQLQILPSENYNSALSAIVKVDKVKSIAHENNGGQVRIISWRNGVIVGGKTYTISQQTQELFFFSNQAFDQLQILAADDDTEFTFRAAEFETVHTTPPATASLKLVLDQHLQIKVSENDVIVNQVKAMQNQPLADAFARIQVTAIDADDSQSTFVDHTRVDQREGIGIADGDDGNSGNNKRIDGDEILQLQIQPQANYSSANQATVGLDRVQSNDNNGGVVKVVAMMGDTVVGEQFYTIDSQQGEIIFHSDTPFDALRLMAGDEDTQFTFKYLDFQVLLD
ncbi:PKD domain-containing protein [Nostocales cyanobacterium LEGE 11386]|nr:PKD domain-containing protein [Nostocales cyanobacterium LEGE 11386]